jgi:tRNA nucleotidyltransferase/poly(A) polymerase
MKTVRKVVRRVIRESFLLEDAAERIPFGFDLPQNVLELSSVFHRNGFELFVVGGAVRDMILGKEPKDWDLVSDATPDEVESMLGDKYRTIPTGKAFGIITVVMPDGEEYEIARYRTDLGKGRRPESGVEFSTIDQDVKRRDLTINALYYDIAKQEIIDYVGGVADIKGGNVKTVGSASERFGEDRLRILRAVRFAARFDSQLDPEIQKALKADNSLEGISKERIRDEFLKGIQSAKYVVKFLETLDRFGLLVQILENMEYDGSYFIEERDPIVLLANLLKDNSASDVKAGLTEQRYTLDEISRIAFLVLFRSFDPSVVVKMKKFQKSSGITDEQVLEFAKWNSLGMKPVNAFLRFGFSVTGDELMSQGFKGRELGQEMERRETENFMKSL